MPTPPLRAEAVPALPDVPAGLARETPVETFKTGEIVVRRDVHRSGRVWSEQALRVLADTGEALVTACAPGAEARWPTLYAKARTEGDRSVRNEAFDAMATGEWDLAPGAWQDAELLLWKAPDAWFSINAFYTAAGMRNWYVNFEHPTRRAETGFDTFDILPSQAHLPYEGRRHHRVSSPMERERSRRPGGAGRPRLKLLWPHLTGPGRS
ncbi:hypothetical protein [Streptomyces flavidovirens]|uniref:Uncharacterized protein n=1 Tax=Streptomyces flavidovirens TaxID=67298 RepID=A0ABW6RN51_9ACTN